jgi:uncharacterized protein YjiS (DUF1127 family)
MTSFPLDITRVTVNLVNLLRWKRHYESAKLENLSDRSLEDIGLEPARRNFAAVTSRWLRSPADRVPAPPSGWLPTSPLAAPAGERR